LISVSWLLASTTGWLDLIRQGPAGPLSDACAAAFNEEDVTPSAVVLTGAFSGADDAEPGGLVESNAGRVLSEDPD
jgi:hypothetical protein